MMTVTPETLPRHELVGLSVRVAAASNPDLIGLTGEVVLETTNTLGIESEDEDRVAHVPKDGTTFEFDLRGGTDPGAVEAHVEADVDLDADADADDGIVTVEGSRLVARPARRTENTGEHTWR